MATGSMLNPAPDRSQGTVDTHLPRLKSSRPPWTNGGRDACHPDKLLISALNSARLPLALVADRALPPKVPADHPLSRSCSCRVSGTLLEVHPYVCLRCL